jgi:hypothetical protein
VEKKHTEEQSVAILKQTENGLELLLTPSGYRADRWHDRAQLSRILPPRKRVVAQIVHDRLSLCFPDFLELGSGVHGRVGMPPGLLCCKRRAGLPTGYQPRCRLPACPTQHCGEVSHETRACPAWDPRGEGARFSVNCGRKQRCSRCASRGLRHPAFSW